MTNDSETNLSLETRLDVKAIVLKRHESLLQQMLIQPIAFRVISLILFLTAFFINFSFLGGFVYSAFALNSSLFWWNSMQIAKSRTNSLEVQAFRKRLSADGETWRTVYIEANGDEVYLKQNNFIEKIEPMLWAVLIVLAAIVRILR